MTFGLALLLAVIQGLTEFLPVSSTAHLTLAENLLLGRSMPLAFDVLLHVGTLLALVVYFRAELLQMLKGIVGRDEEGRKLAGWLLLAMVPTVVFGFATRHLKETAKDHLWIYGLCLLLTAGLLYAANEQSDTVVSWLADSSTGRLTPTEQVVRNASPCTIAFAAM